MIHYRLVISLSVVTQVTQHDKTNKADRHRARSVTISFRPKTQLKRMKEHGLQSSKMNKEKPNELVFHKIAYCTHKQTHKHTWAFVYGACTFDRERTLEENKQLRAREILRFLLQTWSSSGLLTVGWTSKCAMKSVSKRLKSVSNQWRHLSETDF